jgi:hypothetical protein
MSRVTDALRRAIEACREALAAIEEGRGARDEGRGTSGEGRGTRGEGRGARGERRGAKALNPQPSTPSTFPTRRRGCPGGYRLCTVAAANERGWRSADRRSRIGGRGSAFGDR